MARYGQHTAGRGGVSTHNRDMAVRGGAPSGRVAGKSAAGKSAAGKAAAGKVASTKNSVLTCGSRTDVGLVREHNEDSLAVADRLFVVADGMGGHAAGEVASEIAVSTILECNPTPGDPRQLGQAVMEANRNIVAAAMEGRGRKGMGTTVTAATIAGRRLVIAQVGDSRAYLYHGGVLQRLTRDHSLVQNLVDSGQITEAQARIHPERNKITRALGTDYRVAPDMYELEILPGDRLLLCSDGMHGMVEEPLIEDVLATVPDPQDAADQLVSQALAAGGFDNVTCVVVDVAANPRAAQRQNRASVVRAAVLVALLVLILTGSAFGAKAFLDSRVFITVDSGELVVCTGIYGQTFGRDTYQVDHRTGVFATRLDLPQATMDRLHDEGIQADSLSDADALVQTWVEQSGDDGIQAGQDFDGDNAQAGQDASTSESADTSGKDGDA